MYNALAYNYYYLGEEDERHYYWDKLKQISELFMVTMIAPLLFVEGVNVSRVHLRKYIKPVMMMALGIVITTV
ncbi:hypothetical protein, partial [Staphylococcus aureus]|uniref:hypothetical protein n=1 Tax=Staphylococcus aureus TaxID=1280 RepID=UPI00210C6700